MNLIKFLNKLNEQTMQMRFSYERKKLIDYFDTINQNKVSIPSFMLADMAMEEKYGVRYVR